MLRLQNITALPEVLTTAQVHRIIDAATTQRMRTFFWTVYSMGLRLSEGLSLQVGDIDSARMLVHIHRGKGAKDRYLPIPTSTLLMLRTYWLTHRHKKWLFPADGRNHALRRNTVSVAKTPMSETAAQGAMKLITRRIDFRKIRKGAVVGGQNPRVLQLELLHHVGGPALPEGLPRENVHATLPQQRPETHLDRPGV